MRTALFLFLMASNFGFSQSTTSLKKKYLGSYIGEIPSYSFNAEDGQIDVAATSIKIIIKAKEINFEIGKKAFQGTYNVLFEANNYFLLDCEIPNQLATERIMVFKKGKKISRDGLYPQPMAFLKKEK
jgi:hypothetical protein